MKDYHINIFFSEEDGGYIADIPDLEACSAFGRTASEALVEVQKARKAWLAAAGKGRQTHPHTQLSARNLSACVVIDSEMIHGALPRLVVPPRRRIRARAAARFQEPPPPLSSSCPPGSGEWDLGAADYEQMLRRCRASGKRYIPPYDNRIADDTPIHPGGLAELVCQETGLWLGEVLPRAWSVELAERANVVYRHNARFRRRLRTTGGVGELRLAAFMRHWLLALLRSRRPELAARLPSSYASGHELPPPEQHTPPSQHRRK